MYQNKKKKKSKLITHWSAYRGLGIQMLVLMYGLGWLGEKLDHYINTGWPIFLFLGALGGFILVMTITIYKLYVQHEN